MDKDRVLLKWRTLKDWDLKTPAALSAMQEYLDAGEISMSVAAQRDNAVQKAALVKLIRAVDGEIRNDWSGEVMNKDEAVEYVMGY